MTEPAVTLTDYGLFLECVLFAFLLFRFSTHSLKRWFILFFMSLGLAALFGGTVHGFFLDESTAGYKILWPGSLISLGLAALAGWGMAARMLFSSQIAQGISLGAAFLFFIYTGVVLFVTQKFFVAVVHYLPPALFFFIAWIMRYRQSRSRAFLIGAIGMGLTFVAAAIQIAEVALHPGYFDHNAFYHCIQAIALFMIYLAARRITLGEGCDA
jgi:hypothetical protein